MDCFSDCGTSGAAGLNTEGSVLRRQLHNSCDELLSE